MSVFTVIIVLLHQSTSNCKHDKEQSETQDRQEKQEKKLQYYTPKVIKCLTLSLHIISLCAGNDVRALLHFTQGIAEVKSILATTVCVSVCLFLATLPHYCMDLDVTWGMVGVPSSCELLDGFVIGPHEKYRDVYTANAYGAEREMLASACTHSMAGVP